MKKVKCSRLGTTIILSTAIVTPVFSQEVSQGAVTSVLSDSNASSGLKAAPSQRQSAVDDKSSVVSDRPWVPGNETATEPWSAPIGHHQPRALDVPTPPSAAERVLEEESARVDRIVRGICRGC
jgi:hypothetical protein